MERGRAALPLVALWLAALVAFGPALGNDFVNWDDDHNILQNRDLLAGGWHAVSWAFRTELLGVYQPLAWLLIVAEHAVFGVAPWGYHLVSLLLHLGNVAVAYLLVRRLLGASPWAAAAPLLLLAVHPLRTEVVAWASCQAYLPAALFYGLGILAYLKARDRPAAGRAAWLAATAGLYVCAAACKAAAISLPAVLLILDMYPLKRTDRRTALLEKIPLFLIGAGTAVMAVVARADASSVVSLADSGVLSRVALASYGLAWQLIRTVLPFDLAAYYPVPAELSLADPVYGGGLALALAVSGLLVWQRRRWPGLLAAWAVYCVILGPHLGLLRIGLMRTADRYGYVPSVALAVPLAAWFGALTRQEVRRAAGLGAAVAGLAWVGLARRQVATWHDSATLWTQVFRAHDPDGEDHPYMAVALNGYGHYLYRHGQTPQALPYLEKAVKDDPKFPEALDTYGSALVESGRMTDGLAAIERSIELAPDNPISQMNLGVVRLRQGALTEAEAAFTRSLRLDPGNARAHTYHGQTLLKAGRSDEAFKEYEAALRADPAFAEAEDSWGQALAQTGDLAQAEAHFRNAVRLAPDSAKAYSNLAYALGSQGKMEAAAAAAEAAVKADPNEAAAHYNLSVLLGRLGRREGAIAAARAALRLNPAYADAAAQLQSLLAVP